MKIVNLGKGESYQLSPDAKLEVERTNPFFNEYGEQTVPLDLPASEHNRRLLGFPDIFGRREKMVTADASIQDGEYFAQCRQFVLSATRKGVISTSFYINDGSFYSRIRNVKLKDIFKGEFIPGVETVEEGIKFCRGLRDNKNPYYTIFPVLVDNDSGLDSGFSFKIINAYGKERELDVNAGGKKQTIRTFHPDDNSSECDFYNAVQRTEYVNQIPITLPQGYYISPFIRCNYVLERIFKHFGYTLQENFFTETPPFDKMVLVNNVIDVLVNGKIKIADLVPDVTCTDFLAVFRKKFCCEFTSDEGTRTANVIFLRDAVAARPVADLTQSLTAEPTMSYKSSKDFKRVVLSSKNTVSSEVDTNYDELDDLVKAHPTARLDLSRGEFYQEGFSGDYRVYTKLSESSQPYNTGENTEPLEVQVPDCPPEFRTLYHSGRIEDNDYKSTVGEWLYVGKYVTLNSKMEITGKDNQSTSEDSVKLLPMLAFSYVSWGRPEGTISPYDLQTFGYPRVSDYALYYNGPDGIFEKFYREYDTLLRNALQPVKMKLLLTQSQKQNLPAHAKVVVRGVSFFFNKLKFILGSKDEPTESELLTITLSTPIVTASDIKTLFPAMVAKYKWVGRSRITEVDSPTYHNSGLDRDRTFRVIYPPIPGPAWVGKEYSKQTSYTVQQTRHGSFWRHAKYKYTKTEVWLECVEI